MPFPNIEQIQQKKLYVKETERQNCDKNKFCA